ncbi:MAG: PDZ domain-containing protein, partial [Nannocystaceae bacterium]
GGAAKPSAPSPGPSSAACAGGTCPISRAEFNKYLSNPAGLSSQASVSPTGLGYKLTTVRRGSSIERLGFRSGDTITHVNGHALADDADAMALYFGLGQTSTFQVRYLRGGSPGVRTIKVR